MKKILHIRNFGKIKSADIDLQSFILFVGDNNSGKTYVMQLIYGILNYIYHLKYDANIDVSLDTIDGTIDDEVITDYVNYLNDCLEKDKETIVKKIFRSNIPIERIWFDIELESMAFKYFLTRNKSTLIDLVEKKIITDKYFITLLEDGTDFKLEYGEISSISGTRATTKNNWFTITVFSNTQSGVEQSLFSNFCRILFSLSYNILYLPSSRSGLHLLYKNYFLSIGDVSFSKYDDKKQINNLESNLTLPVYNYLRFLQKWQFSEELSIKNNKLLNKFESNLIDGKYKKDKILYYIPKSNNKIVIPFYLSSSMISELIPYYYFLCGDDFMTTDYLMIDEVESSLHPKKQSELVKFLINLNNANKNIIISTHSDSVAAKINNMVMISKQFKNSSNDTKLLNKYNLEEDDIFANPEIKVYSFKNKGTYSIVENVDYDPFVGYSFEGFEDALSSLSSELQKIYEE